MSQYTEYKFSILNGVVSDNTLKAVLNSGFTNLTEIQMKCIPRILIGLDVRGTAKTGSGKTLAFLIPIIEYLRKDKFKGTKGTRAIIIAPTRELTMQIFNVLKELLCENDDSITYDILMGGANRKLESRRLKIGINIVIATPGRLLDHLKNTKSFRFKNLKQLVIDEADRILEIGFLKDIKQIINLLPSKRQTMLFSATKCQKIEDLSNLALKRNLFDVDVDMDKKDATVDGLHQSFMICPTEKRFMVLYTFLRRNKKKKIMVFFNSCLAVKFYSHLFTYIGEPVKGIHGKQKQSKRTNTFFKYVESESGVLLCTDVAARGLDIKGVDWIVQYDPPDDPKEYIHRVGRTARAGANGNALLILREEEIEFINYLKTHKITVDAVDIDWSKVADIQLQLEEFVDKDNSLGLSAKEAFQSYIKAYIAHQLKDVFDPNKLDLKKTAKCFGLALPPKTSIPINLSSKNASYIRHKRPLKKRKSNMKLIKT